MMIKSRKRVRAENREHEVSRWMLLSRSLAGCLRPFRVLALEGTSNKTDAQCSFRYLEKFRSPT